VHHNARRRTLLARASFRFRSAQGERYPKRNTAEQVLSKSHSILLKCIHNECTHHELWWVHLYEERRAAETHGMKAYLSSTTVNSASSTPDVLAELLAVLLPLVSLLAVALAV